MITKANLLLAGIGGFYILFSFLFWMSLSTLFDVSLGFLEFSLSNFLIIFYPIFALILMIVPLSLISILDSRVELKLILITISSSLALFPYSKYLAVGAVMVLLTVIVSLYFDEQVRRSLNNQLKINLAYLLAPSISLFILFMSMCISVGFYLTTSSFIKDFTIEIPDKILTYLIEDLTGGLSQNNEDRVDSIFNNNVTDILMAPLRDRGVTDSETIDTQTDIAKVELSKQTNLINTYIDPKTTFSNQIKSQVQERINFMVDKYRKYLPAFASISLFLLIQTFSPVIKFLSITLSRAIIYIFRKTGIVIVDKVEREAEVIRV